MKIGDKAIAVVGCAGNGFSYGIGDVKNPATHIDVTEANIDHLIKLETEGLVMVLPGEEDSPPAEPMAAEVAVEDVTEANIDQGLPQRGDRKRKRSK